MKLGDFGLARRASNEDGSLLKGTTKYMAPEVMANSQFGPVGPACDLDSSVSGRRIDVRAQFETLFPGLGSFGRDKQIAWMMWHAAADRRSAGNRPGVARRARRFGPGYPAAGRQGRGPAISFRGRSPRDFRPVPRLAGGVPEELDQAAEAARIAAGACGSGGSAGWRWPRRCPFRRGLPVHPGPVGALEGRPNSPVLSHPRRRASTPPG